MNEADWLRIIYLLTALGLILGTWRMHRGGAKRTLVMVLAWVCIFVIAAGIAAYADGWASLDQASPPSPDRDPDFT